MKQFAKKIVVAVLGWQVRRLRKKNNFKVVGVVGSIGKTSTKFAIANVLKQSKTVRFQAGNYNDIVTVPLVFFGQAEPILYNPLAWARTIWRNQRQLKKKYPYDVVVIEIGTDKPGDIASFAKYVCCDITVVTAISAEHMEFFDDIDAVAKEELKVVDYSDQLIINSDLCNKKYYQRLSKNFSTYGQNSTADSKITKTQFSRIGSQFSLETRSTTHQLSMDALGMGEVYSASAATIVAEALGVSKTQIKNGVAKLSPVSGRMNRLKGVKNSLILDDSYNASPVAVIAALDTLYGIKAPQKIAILGNMNELGKHSKAAHQEVGRYCKPDQLEFVITIGPDANKYTAPAAKAEGCKVETFDNPYEAAEFIKQHIKKKAVILAKGSQNGVFAEEAVKLLLENPDDTSKLVRQSKAWLKRKQKGFSRG